LLLILITGTVVFAIVNYVRMKNDDARRGYGQDISQGLDVKAILDDAYMGDFGFDEALPNPERLADVTRRFDAGVEQRLANHLAQRLPKWVLKAAAEDMSQGRWIEGTSHAGYVMTEIQKFAAIRNDELTKLMNQDPGATRSPNSRRRRRR